jgi:hypothetical protein
MFFFASGVIGVWRQAPIKFIVERVLALGSKTPPFRLALSDVFFCVMVYIYIITSGCQLAKDAVISTFFSGVLFGSFCLAP